MTTGEAARLLGVSPGRVRQLVAEKILPATKRGRDNFVTRDAVEKLARDLQAEAPRKRGPKPQVVQRRQAERLARDALEARRQKP